MTFIGVDIGTSVIKAAAFDDAGRQLALQSVPTRVVNPRPGWFEQDMDEVVAAVSEVVGRLAAGLDGPPALLALTGQGDGVRLVDEAGRAVRPAVSWMDARAAGIVDEWQAGGVVEDAFRRTGGAMFPGSPAPVLAWLDAHEPEVLDRAHTAAYCKDMVFQRLTGVRATDASDASQPFLDPRTRTVRRGGPRPVRTCAPPGPARAGRRARTLRPAHPRRGGRVGCARGDSRDGRSVRPAGVRPRVGRGTSG